MVKNIMNTTLVIVLGYKICDVHTGGRAKYSYKKKLISREIPPSISVINEIHFTYNKN